jgi:ParB-like chromosome segregation protein Spo0J
MKDRDIVVKRPAIYEVIDGREVFKALQSSDRDFVDCYVYNDCNLLQAKLIYLEHDITFENNFVEVAKAIKKIAKKHSLIEVEKTVAYNYEELQELLTIADYDFEKFKDQTPDTEQVKFF